MTAGCATRHAAGDHYDVWLLRQRARLEAGVWVVPTQAARRSRQLLQGGDRELSAEQSTGLPGPVHPLVQRYRRVPIIQNDWDQTRFRLLNFRIKRIT
jgi:hypothetical protein